MKFITSIFALLLLSFSLQAATGIPADLVLVATGPKEMVLKMESPLRADLKIEIIDVAGRVLYSDDVKAQATVAKLFKLQQFEVGDYQLVMTNELFETAYAFQVTATGLYVNTSDVIQTFIPVVTVTDYVARLNFMNHDKVAVNVTILDEEGTTVYTEKVPANYVVTRTYDLSALKDNNCRMVVTAGQKSITKYLAL